MFKTAENASRLSKDAYHERVPALREALLNAQFALREAGKPVLIIISGVEGSGKGAFINRLNEWMDTRNIETFTFQHESDEERMRPAFWRFWRKLPPNGKVHIYFGSWYTKPIIDSVMQGLPEAAFEQQMHDIRTTEYMLYNSGVTIVKFWLHISKKEQGKRLKKLEKDKNTRFRVTKNDWEFHDQYDQFAAVSERAIQATDSAANRWHIIDASDDRFRDVSGATILLDYMHRALSVREPESETNGEAIDILKPVNILSRVSFNEPVPYASYKKDLKKLTLQLEELAWKCNRQHVSNVMVFEGWDAAGKGGVIRRVLAGLDAKLFRVIQTAAPTEEERAQHYLWRFWRHIPLDGNTTLYDRSWYGRVLVERVEQFATQTEWKRSYREINEFESQLTRHGTLIHKFWLHITPEEQLKRFKEREVTSYKTYKITEEDWRNREKWETYEEAVHEMVARTSTEHARWHIVAANDKRAARLQVLKTIIKSIKNKI